MCHVGRMEPFRVGQLAALLGVSPRTVRRWLSRGQLRYVRLPGGERRVPRQEIDKVIGDMWSAGEKLLNGGEDLR